MKKAFNIIQEIANTSGRNDKESLLKKHKDNQELKNTLYFVYNPFIVTGLQESKLFKFTSEEAVSNTVFKDIFEVMEYLKVNNTGRDEVIKAVMQFINQSDDLFQFYIQVVTKSLKIGVTSKTLNKCFGKGFIPEFAVMLAKKYEDEEHKVKDEFIITEKLDGMRVVAIKDSETIKFFSRQGQPVSGLTQIESEMDVLPSGFVYDGELLIETHEQLKDRDVLQETLKIARKDGEKLGLQFHLFDMLPLDEFNNGQSKELYKVRKQKLINLISGLDELNYIKVVPNLYEGKDKNVIPELLQQMNEQGKEGLMLNTANGKWVTKRTDQLLKIKSFDEFDEIIVDFVEGEGKYKGMLGSIVVNYKGYPLNIGSGYTDEERMSIWASRESLKGRVCTVQYFRESKNQNGELSVSFPVFKGIREEGKEVSYY